MYHEALALRPNWAEGWFYLAASEYELKHFGEARTAFERATTLAPKNGPGWCFLGLSEYQLADYGRALQHFRNGEALGCEGSPDFSSAVHLHVALLLIQRKQFAPAMQELQAVTKREVNASLTRKAFGLEALGMALLPPEIPRAKQEEVDLAGDATEELYSAHPEAAQASFETLVAKYGNEPGVHYAYSIFLKLRDPDRSMAELRKELQINPSHVFATVELASLELKAGHTDTARQLAKRAVQIEPANPLCLAVLGRTLLKLGQFPSAVHELERAVALAPGDPQMHFYLEQAYYRAGRTGDAQKEKAEFARLKRQQTNATNGLLYTDTVP